MFEQIKVLLTDEYNSEIARFDNLKNQIENLKQQMKADNSEEEYKYNLQELNKKYGFLKRGSKDYKRELDNLRVEYNKKLIEFEQLYSNYVDLKNEAAKINIYVIQKKLEQLSNANTLEDLRITEEEAEKMINQKVGS